MPQKKKKKDTRNTRRSRVGASINSESDQINLKASLPKILNKDIFLEDGAEKLHYSSLEVILGYKKCGKSIEMISTEGTLVFLIHGKTRSEFSKFHYSYPLLL
jgi:hypothetical protein